MGLGDNSVPGLEASGVLVEKHVEQMRCWREGQALKTAGARCRPVGSKRDRVRPLGSGAVMSKLQMS